VPSAGCAGGALPSMRLGRPGLKPRQCPLHESGGLAPAACLCHGRGNHRTCENVEESARCFRAARKSHPPAISILCWETGRTLDASPPLSAASASSPMPRTAGFHRFTLVASSITPRSTGSLSSMRP
jgi:hypothetical protein